MEDMNIFVMVEGEKIPLYYQGKYSLCKLIMIDNTGVRYYLGKDDNYMIRKDGSVASDMEYFFNTYSTEAFESKEYIYLDREYEPYESEVL